MCGRYSLIAEVQALAAHFQVSVSQDFQPRYSIAPSQDIPVIRQCGTKRELTSLHWGLIPFWAKGEKPAYQTINARAETIAVKPTFRSAFRRRRCLIPATGFYEWKPTQGGKQPYHIQVANSDLFAFAGLWEHWESEEGKVVESCAIIVTEANERLHPIHDRMPVILDSADHATWLDPRLHDPNVLIPLLQPYPAEQITLYPVSHRVNNPRHDDPECIRALET